MASDAGAEREAFFKTQLKKYFPNRKQIQFTYSPLPWQEHFIPSGDDSYCGGYDTQESVRIGKLAPSFGWVPHVRGLTEEQLEVLIEDIKKDLTDKQK